VSVVDRNNIAHMRRDNRDTQPQSALRCDIAWTVPARAIHDPRVAALLREALGDAWNTADVRVCWTVAMDSAVLCVRSARGCLEVLRVEHLDIEHDSHQGTHALHVRAEDALALTLLARAPSRRGEPPTYRLAYAQTSAWRTLSIEGGRYDIAELCV
jgi:hypothetical protein